MTIVILGAGDIGGATARRIAAADLVSRVVLVDEATTVAAGKALDIAQAAPVDGYVTRLEGTDDESVVTSAAAVVVADRHGHPPAEWSGDAGLARIERVARLCGAPILCAGPSQVTLVERGVHELGLRRDRLFGVAPEAFRAGVISMVALEGNTAPAGISLLVLGRAPGEVIVPWEAASLEGRRAVDVLAPPAIMRLEQRLPRLWPPGATTLGSATARVLCSMFTRRPQTHVVQVTVSRDEGGSGRSAMLPARFGPHGIVGIERPPLSARDRVRLDTVIAR